MIPRVLTIAGSDSSGGAGIQQDLRTFHALGCWGLSAVTAVTAQSGALVAAQHPVPVDVVAAQIDAAARAGVDAAKTGMLANGAIVQAVAAALRRHRVERLVVDPVVASSGGAELLDAQGRGALVEHLLPLAAVVTPNAPEASLLAGFAVEDRGTQARAARAIAETTGARAVLVTGGHLPGEEVVDVLWDGEGIREYSSRRIAAEAHGTGCTLSAALAAFLARGRPLRDAVVAARAAVAEAISGAVRAGPGAPHARL